MSKSQTPPPKLAGGSQGTADGHESRSGSEIANGSQIAVNGPTIAHISLAPRGPGLQPKITSAVPGPKSRALFAEEQSHIAPGRQRISLLAGVAFDHGEGATLTDVDGNVFVDFFAGVAVASLGHGHPALAQALSRQASRLHRRHIRHAGTRGGLQDARRGFTRGDSSARICTAAAPRRSRRRSALRDLTRNGTRC